MAVVAFAIAAATMALLFFALAVAVSLAEEKVAGAVRPRLLAIRASDGVLLLVVGIWLIAIAIWANLFAKVFQV